MTSEMPVDRECIRCGEDTGPGSVFFSDRVAVDVNGRQGWLCSECVVALSPERADHRAAADLEVIAENGLMIGVGLGTGLA
jgi:hypothetical protein